QWLSIFTKPAQALLREKKGVTLKKAVLNYALISFVLQLLSIALFVVIRPLGLVLVIFYAVTLMPLLVPAAFIAIFLLYCLVLHISAQAFGGHGRFEEVAYLNSVYLFPILLPLTLFLTAAFSYGPSHFFLAPPLGLPSLWIVVFSGIFAYLSAISLKIAHGLTKQKAAAIVIIPVTLAILATIPFAHDPFMDSAALNTQNPTYCAFIIETHAKDYCMYRSIRFDSETDLNVCLTLSNNGGFFGRNPCISEFALQSGNIDVCRKINPDVDISGYDAMGYCQAQAYTAIAAKTKDRMKCDKIGDYRLRTDCYDVIYRS
ncbi:MAG: Yip1 family protein, partial [Candidatus Micrarchaeota archaeon]|nr:Yip1 family protein [Candidatus Micrarchaeota archaeon]